MLTLFASAKNKNSNGSVIIVGREYCIWQHRRSTFQRKMSQKMSLTLFCGVDISDISSVCKLHIFVCKVTLYFCKIKCKWETSYMPSKTIDTLDLKKVCYSNLSVAWLSQQQQMTLYYNILLSVDVE